MFQHLLPHRPPLVADDGQADFFAEPRVGNTKGGGLPDGGMPMRAFLDGGRMDVVAATDDQVLLAANDLQFALGIEPSQAAAQAPAAAVEGLLGARLIVEIADHQPSASASVLAYLSWRGLQVRVLRFPEAHLVARTGFAAGAGHPLDGVGWPGVLVRAVLGHAIDVLPLFPHPPPPA